MGIMMGNPKDDQQKKQTIGNKIINEIINTFSSIVPSKIWNNPT